jgi:hypothetical protein
MGVHALAAYVEPLVAVVTTDTFVLPGYTFLASTAGIAGGTRVRVNVMYQESGS